MTEQDYLRRERECICEESGVAPERAREIAAQQVEQEQSTLWPSDEEMRATK
jgi:hypothetical protein